MATNPFKTFFNKRSGKTEYVRPFEFKNQTVKKEFLKFIEESQAFSGAGGQMPEKYKTANIAKRYKVSLATLERALSDLRSRGIVAERGASIPIDVVRTFYPELLDKDGNISKQKWLSTPSETRKIIAGKALVEGVREGLKPGGKIEINKKQAKEIKKFLDKFIEFEKQGLEGRLFLGNSPSRWIKTDVGTKGPALELYQELAKADSFKRNLKDASSFQFVDEFKDSKYQNAIKRILSKYLEPSLASTRRDTGEYRIKNKDVIRKKYLKDVYDKEFKNILSSKEFKNSKDINQAIKIVNDKLSDTLKFPNISTVGTGQTAAELAETPFNFFKYGSSLSRVELNQTPFNTVANAFLKTAGGKKALEELSDYVENQRAIGKINILDPNARSLIDKRYANYRNAMSNPRLDVFFKPLRKLGVIQDLKEKQGREIAGNTFNRLQAFNNVSKVVPAVTVNYFSNEKAKARSALYQKRYQANLAKITDLPERFKNNPTAYKTAVENLNKVLSAQLGGLELAGEHRLGMSLLTKDFNPNYVSRMVLGSNAFNNMKNQFIESQVAQSFNNPRFKPETRARIYNDAVNRFVKEFELPTSISKTLPKFDVQEGRLIETQLERNVGRLGIDGLGNLKATVKNALIEQALVDRKFPGAREGKAADFILQSKRAGIKNAPLVSKILNTIDKEGPGSTKIDKLVNNLVEGEFEKTVNAESMKQFGRRFCKEGCLAVTVDKDPVIARKGLEQTIGKFATGFKTFATSPGFKTFSVAGLAGGAAAALVKEFRNDDPTTYLSNEDQQKNMLVDMVTQPISEDIIRPDILDYQLPAVGASLAASTALGAPSTIKASRSRGLGVEQKGLIRTGGRVLGRGLGIAASPGVLAPLAALDITRQVSEGDSLADIATDPLNYTYPIFAEQTPRLTRGLPSAFRKFASLGLSKPALRLLSRAGIAGLGASLAIQGIGLLDD